MRMKRNKTVLFLIGIMTLVFLAGCYMTQPGQSRYSTKTEKRGKTPVTTYEFKDVQVPSQMKVDKKATSIYQTGEFTGGVLTLKGRVEIDSLISFFKRTMVEKEWRPVSSFKSPQTFLLFNKGNKWCVIILSESDFSTQATIWVAPTIQNPSEPATETETENSGLFK